MNENMAIVGAGNMAQALIHGLIESQLLTPKQLFISAPSSKNTLPLQKKYPEIQVFSDNQKAVDQCQIIVLAVKPQQISTVLQGLTHCNNQALFVSLAAGISLANIEKYGNHLSEFKPQFARAMPNVNALIRQSYTGVCFAPYLSLTHQQTVNDIFQSIGRTAVLDEKNMNAFTAVAGSSPAFIAQFIEALSDAAVLQGLPRELSLDIALENLIATASYLQITQQHPAILRERVSSPGGTTMAGLAELQRGAFNAQVINAIAAAKKRGDELNS